LELILKILSKNRINRGKIRGKRVLTLFRVKLQFLVFNFIKINFYELELKQ
jgi:hypothetical protein